jgi:hypothetical protein
MVMEKEGSLCSKEMTMLHCPQSVFGLSGPDCLLLGKTRDKFLAAFEYFFVQKSFWVEYTQITMNFHFLNRETGFYIVYL